MKNYFKKQSINSRLCLNDYTPDLERPWKEGGSVYRRTLTDL